MRSPRVSRFLLNRKKSFNLFLLYLRVKTYNRFRNLLSCANSSVLTRLIYSWSKTFVSECQYRLRLRQFLARSQGVSDLPSRVTPLPSTFTPLCLSVLRLGLFKTLYLKNPHFLENFLYLCVKASEFHISGINTQESINDNII